MDTLKFILDKFNIKSTEGTRSPVELPGVTRYDLAKWFNELGFRTGAEIGVSFGDFSWFICELNRGIQHNCIDPWTSYDKYSNPRHQKRFNAAYKETCRRLRGAKNTKIIKDYSMNAVKKFKDNSLDFAYIDGNHDYEHVYEDIEEWAKKVRPGGIVAGHDYIKFRRRRCEVVYALHDYVRKNNISPWFLLGTKDIKPLQVREKYRSFMFVK